MSTEIEVDDIQLKGYDGPVIVEINDDLKVTDLDKLVEVVKEVNDAKVIAETSATSAKSDSLKAEAAANRAEQVAGLDTVDQAVALALAESNQYTMTKADFDALREDRKRDYAGSGFAEWGKHIGHYSHKKINEGMWEYIDSSDPNALFLGRGTTDQVGVSRTNHPIVIVDGVEVNLYGTVYPNPAQFQSVEIHFPPAPNGTKTYDSATGVVFDYATEVDPKYGNVAADLNEAVARAFEGIVFDGDFSEAETEWFKSPTLSSSSISAGKVHFFSGTGSTVESSTSIYNRKAATLKKGTKYVIEYTITRVGEQNKDSFTFQYDGRNVGQLKPIVGTHKVEWVSDVEGRHALSFIRWSGGNIVADFDITNVSVREVTNQVITTRKDLAFLEVWHEDVSEKGVIFPFGNVQYGASVAPWGAQLSKVSVEGIAQGYSAFGEWDKSTEGYCDLISTMSTAALQRCISDPRNNCYYDPETKKLIQVRYRIRVVEGLGDDWQTVIPAGKFVGTKRLAYKESHSKVSPQGSSTASNSFTATGNYYERDLGNPYISKNIGFEVGVFPASAGNWNDAFPGAYKGKCFALPIALVQRLNQGAYHPVWNPFGCNKWSTNPWSGRKAWHMMPTGSITSTSLCFKESTFVGVRYTPVGGDISVSDSGRPTNDPYQFYDAIYAGQVEDLRLSANKQDVNKLREDAIRKAVAGEMRGKGKVPFTKVGMNTLGSGTHASASKQYALTGFGPSVPLFGAREVFNKLGIVKDTIVYVVDTSTGKYIKGSAFSNASQEDYVYLVGSSVENHGMPNEGTGLTLAIVVEELLSPEFDSLPYVNIIGSPEHIAATFPNGVYGEWIPKIPTGSEVQPLTRKKAIAGSLSGCLITTNLGSTWTSVGIACDDVQNIGRFTVHSSGVALIPYQANSNFTEKADNSVVVGSVGDVNVSSSNEVSRGNRLMPSLIGEIGKNATGAASYEDLSMLSATIALEEGNEGKLVNFTSVAPSHAQMRMAAPQNNSPAVKALSTITAKDGLLYLQLHGSELEYKTPVMNNATVNSNLTKGELRVLRGVGLNVDPCVIHVKQNYNNLTASTFSGWYVIDGKVVNGSGVESGYIEPWNGSGWGDDSTIPVISGEGTKEDLNGNIVKTFCHHSQIPLGIADYTSSSQSK